MLLLAVLLCAGSAMAALPESVEWTVVDVGAQKSVSVPDEAAKLADGGELQAQPEGMSLRLEVRYEKVGMMMQPADTRASRIRVRVVDQSGRDRGLVTRLSLALPAGEWQWMQDLDTAVPLGDKPLSNTAALRELPGLPEFPGGERPDYGRYSAYPLGAVEQGGEYVALARPISQLALVRFIGQGGPPRLMAELDFALSEYTNPPREAEFELEFVSGRTRPGGSMRAALPFAHTGNATRGGPAGTQAPRPGGWMPFTDLAKIPNVDEFGFGYQEGAPNAKFDDALGAASFVYFHCAGEFANVEGYKRGTEPLPPYETIIAAFNRVAQQHSGVENVWNVCGIQDAEGRIAYRPERTYGDFFCQACVDPDLPYGKAMADRLIERVTATQYPEGIDGCYYDGIAAGLDYAPEHLRAANHLLLWDGNLSRPVNYNLWSSIEWTKHIYDRFAGTGKMTMLNDSSLVSFTFAGPYIDVPGGEMSIYLQRDQARLIRALLMGKPFCTLVKADFTQVSQAQMETYMRRCTAYGILFGFFDISPSGDHPGSSYWAHPEWYDRDRPLFRRYMPIASELVAAGWQPQPPAEAKADGAFIEWFGKPEGAVHYAALSTDPRENALQPQAVTVSLPRGALAVELLTGRIQPDAGTLATEMTGEDLQVWALASPEAQAQACLRRAQDVIGRREQYIAATRAVSDSLAPWASYAERGGRIVSPGHEGGFCLMAEKDQAGVSAGATQTINVKHDEPKKLIVSAWSKAENVAGPKDRDYALYVDCYYTDGTAIYGQTVEFDTGTHDWQYGERTIEPEKPIRNINVYLLFRGAHTGRVWFDDVRVALADDPDKNLLPRGDFETARERTPMAGESPQAVRLNEAFAKLSGLADQKPGEIDWAQARRTLDEIDGAVKETDWGADAERCKRDAADVRWHVELAQVCLAGKPQPAQRASRLTELVALDRPRASTGPVQYRANTGEVPQGTIVVVDSNYEGYSAQPLTDGQINPKDAHWTKVAWASGDYAGPHWIELRFPQPTKVREVRLWAALDAGTLHVPQKVEAQAQVGDKWAPIEGQQVEAGENGLVTIRLRGEALKALRVFQAPHGGSKDRPDLMWISELQTETE
jgi:hypothetical protein